MHSKRLPKYLVLAFCITIFIVSVSIAFHSTTQPINTPSANTGDIVDAPNSSVTLMANAVVDDVIILYPTTASGTKNVNIASKLPPDIISPQYSIQCEPSYYVDIFVDAPTIDSVGNITFEFTTSLFVADVQSLVTVKSDNYNDILFGFIVSINDQLPPDILNPTAQRTGVSTASMQFVLEEVGTINYVVRPLGTATPTADEIVADPLAIKAACFVSKNSFENIAVSAEPCAIHFFVTARGIPTSVFSINVQGYTVTLEAPSDLRWSADSSAFAYWLPPANIGAAVVTYDVSLYRNGELAETLSVTDTAIDLLSYIGKNTADYTFTVTAKTTFEGYCDSPVSTMSAVFTVLDTPSAPIWNGSELMWDAIPNADSYRIELFYNGGITPVHSVVAVNAQTYDFAAFFGSVSVDGSYTAIVTAMGSGCGESAASPLTDPPYYDDGIAPTMDITKVIRAQHTMALVRITTDEPGNIYYIIQQAEDAPPTTPPTDWQNYGACVVGSTDMTINTLTAGEKVIYAAVVDDAGNISNIVFMTISPYAPPPLETPTNLRWEDNVARWDAVENAVGYHVKVYNSYDSTPTALQTITNGSITSSRDFSAEIARSGSYTFKVKAVANTDTDSDSEYAVSPIKEVVGSLSGAAVMADAGSYIYNGKPHTPVAASVTVLIDDRELPPTAYDIEAENNIDAGEATIIVTAKSGSGYYGSATGTFTISPRAMQITAPDLISYQGVMPARLNDADTFKNAFRASVAEQVLNSVDIDRIVNALPTEVIIHSSTSIYTNATVGSMRPNDVPNHSGNFGISFTKKRIGNYMVSGEMVYIVNTFPHMSDANILSNDIPIGGEVARLVADSATVNQSEIMLNAAPDIMQNCTPAEKAMLSGALSSADDIGLTTLELNLLTVDGGQFSNEPTIPPSGIEITVPYNVLNGSKADEFVVLHLLPDGNTEMFSTESVPPTAKRTDDGIKLRVNSFSPFMFISQLKAEDTVSSKPTASSKPTSSKPTSSKPSSSKPSSSKPTSSKNNSKDKNEDKQTDTDKAQQSPPKLHGRSEVPQTSDTTPLTLPIALVAIGSAVLRWRFKQCYSFLLL